ncbi:hypothetical protein BC332_16851 [Capsicum chinense]|nr:hypothetical protein BC332_16851 [Capsicum chinense]
MVYMAKLLVQRGVTVTLVITPLNAIRFTAGIDRAIGPGFLIRVLEHQFPAKEAGLLEGCESAEEIKHHLTKKTLKKCLDSWQPESVVYACLGSLSRITIEQFVELALGLEASGCPFILVIKAGEGQAPIEDWISKNGFEQRTNGRGFLIRGWAPQLLILSHLEVGEFLTHCGWNSTLEGIGSGVSMFTWPLFSDQFLKERFLVHVLKTGASVGSQGVMHLGEEEKPESK